MSADKVWEDYASLPIEAQKQAAEFITFLRQRHTSPKAKKEKPQTDLSKESFVGMWSDREDMQDSTEWVRRFRKGHH